MDESISDLDQPTRETFDFLSPWLAELDVLKGPILEVGCGDGRLAAALLARGFAVTAIDSNPRAVRRARRRGVPAIEVDVVDHRGTYAAVLFTRSLHHAPPLAATLDAARRLLAPNGLLIAEEFARERMDETTARWFYGQRAILEATGVLVAKQKSARELPSLDRWERDHEHDPPLARGDEMRAAITQRFEIQFEATAPYLYRDFARWLAKQRRGEAIVEEIFALERDLIRGGVLTPLGQRIVARG